MAREALQLKLDSLVWDKERLEAENARLRDQHPDNADLVGLQSEVERYKLESERLLKDVKKIYKSKDSWRSVDPTQIEETEALVEQQRQLCEDMQAELAEAAERNSSWEERCCQLEEELQRVREEAELERLRDLGAGLKNARNASPNKCEICRRQ